MEPVAQIVINLFANGQIQVGGKLPSNELLVLGLLEKGRQAMAAEFARQAAEATRGPALLVAGGPLPGNGRLP